MKSYLLLLRLNLRNLLAGLRGGSFRKDNGKIDKMRIFVMLVGVLGIAVMAGMVIFLEITLYEALSALRQEKLLIALAVLLSMITTLLFGVFHTLASLYFGKDIPNMAHLPLSPRAIMAAKWTEIYLSELLISGGILLPVMILYGLDHGLGVLYYLRMAAIVLTTPMYPLAIALLLASILGRLTSLTRHKEVWVVIGTLLMLVVVIGGEWMLLPHIPEDADVLYFAKLFLGKEALLQTLVGAFPPVLWAVHGLEGHWAQWGLYILVGAAVIGALIFLLGRSYLNVCLKHTEQGTRRRRGRKGEITYKQRSPLMALYCREMNEALKVPTYLMNGALGVLMMPLMLGGMWVGLTAAEESAVVIAELTGLLEQVSQLDMTLILSALFALMCFVTPLISTAVSREGGRLQISRMIPVSARIQLRAKLLMNMTVNGVGSLIMGAVIVMILGAQYSLCVLGALILANLLSYATGAANLTIDAMHPVLNWKNETQVMKQNMNQVLGMLISVVMIALPVAAPIVLLVMMEANAVLRFVSVILVLLLECGVGLMLMRLVAEKRYAQLEP